ncbi:MAG: T9SS type A sorting domain-containing protein, partial [Endomicrobia bacterium]|nr:T9SS type A sorting domain-containing protein [Endomicrobiia bacterium]
PLGISVGKRGLGIASADWSRLRVDKSTQASDMYSRFDRSSWTLVEVWRDVNGDGLLSPHDVKLGESRFENNVALIIFDQPEKIDKQEYLLQYATYFVTCYIPKNAQPYEKLQLFLSTGSYFTLGGVDIVESDNFPLVSPLVTIADWPDEVSFEPTSLAPTEAALYETDVLLAKIDLLAFCDATLEEMVITHEGTSQPESTVKLVKVYLDDGDLRFDKEKDIVISTGSFDSLGKCRLKFFNPGNILRYDPVLILDETVRIFVVFDFNEDAIPDKTIGFGIDPTGLNYNLPNRQKPFGYFSTSKIMLLDKRTPTKPKIFPYVPLNKGVDTGKEIENLVYYTPHNNEIRFNWYSEAPFGGGIKSGYAGISLRKPVSIDDHPDLVRFIPIGDVGDFTLSGLNLEHNKVYYLWVKAESNAGFTRLNYVSIFIDKTPPAKPFSPFSTLPSNNIFWVNSNLSEDEESFIESVEIEERIHQEYIWNNVKKVSLPLQEIIKDIYMLKLPKKVEDEKIIFSSRSVLSEDIIVEYSFVATTSVPQNLEVVNFKSLFSYLGYKLEKYSIKLESRFLNKQNNKVYYYRIRTKNVVGLYSDFSDTSEAIYLTLPKKTILELTTFPNPCDVRKNTLKVSYILTEDAEVNIKIFDILGNLVYQKNYPFGSSYTTQGTHFIEISESKDFSAGMYILFLETKNRSGHIENKRWKIGIIK